MKEQIDVLQMSQLTPVDNSGSNGLDVQQTRRQHHCETMSNESGAGAVLVGDQLDNFELNPFHGQDSPRAPEAIRV